MAYYIMKQDTSIEGSAAVDSLPENIDPSEWIQGKPMPDPGKLVLDLSEASGDYRGDIIDGLITLYRSELKKALEDLGVDNIQYYPVRLKDWNSNKTEGGYWIANIIGLFDCIDMKKSKMKPWRTGIGYDFESIVINDDKTHGAKIFRLKENPTLVVINEELKQYFDKTDILVGVEIKRTEEYSDW